MTVPPGTVIPRPSLPSWTQARNPVRPARCLPIPRSATVRWFSYRGQRTLVGNFRAMDRTALARRIYDAAHLTGTFTLRSGAVSSEYFDKYRFEADPVLLRDIAEAMAADGSRRDRRARRPRTRRGSARDDYLASHRRARSFRSQRSEDLRDVPARRGRRARRLATVHHRGRRHVGRRDSRRCPRVARPRCAARTGAVRDRSRVGRGRQARGRRPRAPAALHDDRAQRGFVVVVVDTPHFCRITRDRRVLVLRGIGPRREVARIECGAVVDAVGDARRLLGRESGLSQLALNLGGVVPRLRTCAQRGHRDECQDHECAPHVGERTRPVRGQAVG